MDTAHYVGKGRQQAASSSSLASAALIPARPAFAAATADRFFTPRWPDTPPILTIDPSINLASLGNYCARLCAWAESTWWVVLIGVANKMQYLRRSWTLPIDLKHNEANLATISMDMLYLRVAQTPRSPDPAIFVLTTTDDRRRQTQPITLPLAHARGVIISEGQVETEN